MGNYTSIVGSANGTNVRDLRLPNVLATSRPSAASRRHRWHDERTGNTTGDNPKAVMMAYDNGPCFASLGHERVDNAGAAAALLVLTFAAPSWAWATRWAPPSWMVWEKHPRTMLTALLTATC
jgi:hypothetical protein